VLPIAGRPLRNGWVGVEAGRIAAAGGHGDADGAIDLGDVALLPGLVNAHTHLELSYLRGAVPPSARFTDWIGEVMRLRRAHPDPSDAVILHAARSAIQEVRAFGTALVGDISNTLVTVPLMQEAGVPGVVFHELLGFNVPDAEAVVRAARARLDAQPRHPDVRLALAPHAPYSVSPALFRAIKRDVDQNGVRSTVHIGESREEVEFIAQGSGPWRALLEELGAWNPSWTPAGVSPVAYLTESGFLDQRVLAVHGVQFTAPDLARLAARQVTVVSCPRSNRYVGVGSPPIEAFYAAGMPVAFGTDSLASADTLEVFAELAEAHRIAPGVPARQLLESATRVGAEALGFGTEFGTIEAGKRAALIAVTLPRPEIDVEEYLVSGVTPDRIRWVGDANPKSQ